MAVLWFALTIAGASSIWRRPLLRLQR